MREGHLYFHVKWVGSRRLTWEAAENFDEERQVINSKYKIENIVGEEHAGKEYLVKWKGKYEETWEAEANLDGAQIKIQQFEDETIGYITDDVELSLEENVVNAYEGEEVVDDTFAHSDGDILDEVEILKRKLAECNESLAKTNREFEEYRERSEYQVAHHKQKNIELTQSLARLGVGDSNCQIWSCSCPQTSPCTPSCPCQVARLECGPLCGCLGSCPNCLPRNRAEVRRSNVQGNGCFALEEIRPGESIGEYTGSVILPYSIAKEREEENEGESKYAMDLDITRRGRKTVGLILDAEINGSAITRANTLFQKSNAVFVEKRVRLLGNSRVGLAVFAEATKLIAKDEEIFIDYGDHYPIKEMKRGKK